MMKPVLISLPPELEKGAKKKAATNYESLAGYIRRLIIRDLSDKSQPVTREAVQ